MKNSELFILQSGLSSVSSLQGVKFAYVISKNKLIIKKEIESFQELLKMTEKFKEYDTKRVEFCKSYAKKDKNNNPILENGSYTIENKIVFDEKIDKLREEYKEEVEAREKQIEEYNEFIKEESKLELYKIKLDNLPENISSVQLDVIMNIIEE